MVKNISKVVFVIIGTLIGAGFASGQEIYIFFFSHGVKGIIGILTSCALMGIVIAKTLKIIYEEDIRTYKDFLDNIIKNNINNNINIIINIFILVTFFIMIAGFGAYFEQELGINSIIGSSILAVLSFIIFLTSIKRVVKTNGILIPILIISLSIIGILNIKEINLLNFSNYIIDANSGNFFMDAILYCSYNSILLIPVLITLKNYLKSKKQISWIAIITTIITILLSIFIFFILLRIDVDITKLEMPAVYVVSNMFKFLQYIYGFIILTSIFTTAISLGTSFLQNTAKDKKRTRQIALLICVSAILVSKIGFSNLVNFLYPMFG